MLIDIEAEYSDYIRKKWHKLSELTSDILNFHRKSRHTYDIVSQYSIEFLQEKLRNRSPGKDGIAGDSKDSKGF